MRSRLTTPLMPSLSAFVRPASSRRRWLIVSDYGVCEFGSIIWDLGLSYASGGELLDERQQAETLGLGFVITLGSALPLLLYTW